MAKRRKQNKKHSKKHQHATTCWEKTWKKWRFFFRFLFVLFTFVEVKNYRNTEKIKMKISIFCFIRELFSFFIIKKTVILLLTLNLIKISGIKKNIIKEILYKTNSLKLGTWIKVSILRKSEFLLVLGLIRACAVEWNLHAVFLQCW